MFAIPTRRLGDAIHTYAVVASGARAGGSPVFSVHADHVDLFAGTELTLLLSTRGTTWMALDAKAFAGPRHDEHVRVTMARAAGVPHDRDALSAVLAFAAPRSARRYVIVCPDAAVRYKEWHENRWREVVEYLVSRGFIVAFCRAAGRPAVPLPKGAHHVDVSLLELARLMVSAAFVVGTDSGHIHLADAIGVPVIGLYAATSSVTYGPFSDRRFCVDVHREAFPRNVRYSTAVHHRLRAMDAITVDAVIAMAASVEAVLS